MERRWRETDSSTVREELGKYRHTKTCPDCHGSRLRAEARHVLIGNEPGEAQRQGRAIFEVEALSLADCLAWFQEVGVSGANKEIAHRNVRETADPGRRRGG